MASTNSSEILFKYDRETVRRIGSAGMFFSIISLAAGLTQTIIFSNNDLSLGLNTFMSVGTICGGITLIINTISTVGAAKNTRTLLSVGFYLNQVGLLINVLLTISSLMSPLIADNFPSNDDEDKEGAMALDIILLLVPLVQMSLLISSSAVTGQYFCCKSQNNQGNPGNQLQFSNSRRQRIKWLSIVGLVLAFVDVLLGVVACILGFNMEGKYYSINSQTAAGVWINFILIIFSSITLVTSWKKKYNLMLASLSVCLIGAVLSAMLLIISAISAFATNPFCKPPKYYGLKNAHAVFLCERRNNASYVDVSILISALIYVVISIACSTQIAGELKYLKRISPPLDHPECQRTVTQRAPRTTEIQMVSIIPQQSLSYVVPPKVQRVQDLPPSYDDLFA